MQFMHDSAFQSDCITAIYIISMVKEMHDCDAGWKRWSDPATWGGSVPGINGSRGNLTISCGQFVLFDVPVKSDNTSGVVLSSLIVAGHLMFADNASLPLLGLDADYIIVSGNLTIGSSSQHFRHVASSVCHPLNPYMYTVSLECGLMSQSQGKIIAVRMIGDAHAGRRSGSR